MTTTAAHSCCRCCLNFSLHPNICLETSDASLSSASQAKAHQCSAAFPYQTAASHNQLEWKLWLPSYFNFVETPGEVSVVNTATIRRQLHFTERIFSKIEIQVTPQQFALTFQQHTLAFQLKGMKYDSLHYAHDSVMIIASSFSFFCHFTCFL